MVAFFQQVINGLSLGAVYALLAVGYSLVYSILSFSNFSHGGFMVVGAYAGYYAVKYFGLSLITALVFAVFMGGLVSITAERIAYKPVRLRGGDPKFFMIASLGIGILIENTVRLAIGPQFRAYPEVIPSRVINVGPFSISIFDIVAGLVAAVGLVALEFYITKTKAGTAIRASASDMKTAGLMGINVDKLILKTFFISGMLAGLGGMFIGIKYTVYPTMGNIQTKAMIGAIFGGLGSISGAIYGAMIVGVLEILVAGFISSKVRDIFVFGVLIIVLLVKPNGLRGRTIEEKV